MSNKKNSRDNNFNIYSSDYIDYKPSLSRAKSATSLPQRFIKIISIAVTIIILLHIIPRIPNLFQTSSLKEFSESIEKIALDASTLNSELDELTKQLTNLIKNETPRLDKKTMQEIEINLDSAASHLERVSHLLKSESKRLRSILEMDKSK